MRDARDAAGPQILAQMGDEGGWFCGRGARKLRQVAAEAALDKELLPNIGLCEFEQKDSGGEVVGVGEAKTIEGLGELVCDDLYSGKYLGN